MKTNQVSQQNLANTSIDRQEVIDALLHHWSVNANNIQVKVSENTVTLKGFVASIYQKEEAEKVVSKIPGVMQVDNQLNVVVD